MHVRFDVKMKQKKKNNCKDIPELFGDKICANVSHACVVEIAKTSSSVIAERPLCTVGQVSAEI